MNEHEITNLNKNPSLDYEAVPEKYVDTQRDARVAKSGDTMTGVLNMNGGLNYPQTNGNNAAVSVNYFNKGINESNSHICTLVTA